MKNKLVNGWGVNDVDYSVTKHEVMGSRKKIVWTCPYYVRWVNILHRCFNLRHQERNPTYKGCTVAEEWKYFSDFIKWVDSQPNKGWVDCDADKDFLFVGNKHYSPDTVVFVSSKINKFITDSGRARGDYMIGVSYKPNNSKKNPYQSRCSNPFTGKQEYLGYYSAELVAHLTWQERKHELACQLADLQSDERVARALRERYTPDKDWTKI